MSLPEDIPSSPKRPLATHLSRLLRACYLAPRSKWTQRTVRFCTIITGGLLVWHTNAIIFPTDTGRHPREFTNHRRQLLDSRAGDDTYDCCRQFHFGTHYTIYVTVGMIRLILWHPYAVYGLRYVSGSRRIILRLLNCLLHHTRWCGEDCQANVYANTEAAFAWRGSLLPQGRC